VLYDADIPLLLFCALAGLLCMLICREFGKSKAQEERYLKELEESAVRSYELRMAIIQECLMEARSRQAEGQMQDREIARLICTRLFGEQEP